MAPINNCFRLTHGDPPSKQATPPPAFPRLFDICIRNLKTGKIFQARQIKCEIQLSGHKFPDLKNVRVIFYLYCIVAYFLCLEFILVTPPRV